MHRIKALFVLTWVAAASVHGAIEYARVFRDDRPLIEVTRPFGFGSRGHIDISLRDITLWRRHDQVDEDYNLAKFGKQLLQHISSTVYSYWKSTALLLI